MIRAEDGTILQAKEGAILDRDGRTLVPEPPEHSGPQSGPRFRGSPHERVIFRTMSFGQGISAAWLIPVAIIAIPIILVLGVAFTLIFVALALLRMILRAFT